MQWQVDDPEDGLFQGTDAYYQWRLGAGRTRRLGLDAWRPVILRLKSGKTSAAFAEGPDRPKDWASYVRIGSFYRQPVAGLEKSRYLTALVRERFFGTLEPGGYVRNHIDRITVLPPIVRDEAQDDPPSVPEIEPEVAAGSAATASLSRQAVTRTVVIGVIDFGIAFAHHRFRLLSDRSRVEYFWVQDGIPRAPGGFHGLGEVSPPFGYEAADPDHLAVELHPVPYGRELTKPEIDHLLDKQVRRELANEDALYRHMSGWLGRRWWRSVARRTAHGTHIMDLACGYDPRDDHEREWEQRPIVAVQLPEAATADTSGENLDSYALDGVRYILDRADLIAKALRSKPLPVVINFSYGNVAGPHDGTSDLEGAFDEMIKAYPNLSMVIPAGNSHLGRLHAAFDFPRPAPDDRALHASFDPDVQELCWRVLPDDRTPSFLEIWLPRPSEERPWQLGDSSRVSLTITAPGGEPSEPLGESNGSGMQLSSDGEVLCEARYRYISEPDDGRGRGMFLIALQPTVRTGVVAPIAPAGVWTVRLENVSLESDQFVEAWIQRDDTPFGFRRRGRQSYFDQRCYQRFDRGGRIIENDPDETKCVIKRAGSMNAIATGEKTVVVGGYVRASGVPARYSAGGPKRQPSSWKRAGPDVLAVSDESLVHQGVLAAGTRSGSVVPLNGTSVAAPQIARRLAIELSNDAKEVLATEFVDLEAGSLGRSIVRSLAETGGPRQPSQERGGAGLVGTDDEIDRRQRRRRRTREAPQAPHPSAAEAPSARGAADQT